PVPRRRRGERPAPFRGMEELDEVPAGGPRIGAWIAPIEDDRGGAPVELIDLHRPAPPHPPARDSGAPEAEAASQLPAEPPAFLRRFTSAERAARRGEAFVRKLLRRFPCSALARVGALERVGRARPRA